MAIVSGGWKITITVVDNGGDVTTRTYDLQSADDIEAGTDSAAVLAAFMALTDAVLLSHQYYEVFVNDALAFPASGVENQNQALLDFLITDDPTKHATLSIPAPKPGIFMSTSGPSAEIIDVADAAVIAFAALFIPAASAFLSDGETADALVGGHRRHVRSRRG